VPDGLVRTSTSSVMVRAIVSPRPRRVAMERAFQRPESRTSIRTMPASITAHTPQEGDGFAASLDGGVHGRGGLGSSRDDGPTSATA